MISGELANVSDESTEEDVFLYVIECALFFKLMPDKSLIFRGEKCHGGKLCKERIILLLCANSDGSDK